MLENMQNNENNTSHILQNSKLGLELQNSDMELKIPTIPENTAMSRKILDFS